MKKNICIVATFLIFCVASSATNFYKNYYIDSFGDKTNAWYIYSEKIYGTSPNTTGGTTNFECKLCLDTDYVFFDLRRSNGDRYSGNGTIYVKLENGDMKSFYAENKSNGFYPEKATSFRNLILKENKIKVVIEINKTNYSFNLGTIDLTRLHNMLK